MNTLTAEEITQHFPVLEKNLTLQRLCRITIKNDTPPNWQVRIITAATEFHYRDGEKFTDYNQNINIGSGGTTYTESHDATKCVGEARTVIYVVVPGEQPVPFGIPTTCPADQCLFEGTVVLAPKQSVSLATFEKGSLQEFLQVKPAE